MRIHLVLPVALPLVLGAILLACGDTPERPTTSDREDRDDDNNDDDDQGGTDQECYDNGWWDCEDYYDPEPSYWGCSGSAADDYWDGYCDCEYYYNDLYYCG